MAVEVAPHRPTLVAELRRLGVEGGLIAVIADPHVPEAWFARSAAVPYWDAVLAAIRWAPPTGELVPDGIFGAASAAYLHRWRVEWEDEQLMADARALARAARAHLPET
jgi:hypothetical protein